MQVKIIDFSEREAWDSYVMENPNSIAWQQFSWYDVLKKNYDFTFYPLAAYDKSKICGILPLYYYKTLLRSGALISVPFAVAGGIVADSEAVKLALLDEAVNLSRQYDSCKIVLKQYKIKMPGDLTSDENYYNRELTLSTDLDKLSGEIAEENLVKISEAGKLSPEVVYPFENINQFYSLLMQHHRNRGIPCVTKKWIMSLIDSDMYTMAVIKINGIIVAGTMVKVYKDTVSFPFTSLAEDGEKGELNLYYLYWELIKKFALDKIRIFHSGRIPVTDEADAYRLGWGGVKYTYYNQYFPKSVSVTEFKQKRGKKRALFVNVWQKTPGILTRMVNRQIIKQFP